MDVRMTLRAMRYPMKQEEIAALADTPQAEISRIEAGTWRGKISEQRVAQVVEVYADVMADTLRTAGNWQIRAMPALGHAGMPDAAATPEETAQAIGAAVLRALLGAGAS